MTDETKVRLHLAILAAYSLLFSYATYVLVFGKIEGKFDLYAFLSWTLLATGPPSVLFLFLARKMLKDTVQAWLVHVVYVLGVVWTGLIWMLIFGFFLIGQAFGQSGA